MIKFTHRFSDNGGSTIKNNFSIGRHYRESTLHIFCIGSVRPPLLSQVCLFFHSESMQQRKSKFLHAQVTEFFLSLVAKNHPSSGLQYASTTPCVRACTYLFIIKWTPLPTTHRSSVYQLSASPFINTVTSILKKIIINQYHCRIQQYFKHLCTKIHNYLMHRFFATIKSKHNVSVWTCVQHNGQNLPDSIATSSSSMQSSCIHRVHLHCNHSRPVPMSSAYIPKQTQHLLISISSSALRKLFFDLLDGSTSLQPLLDVSEEPTTSSGRRRLATSKSFC